jgi:hypothetical protein
MQETIDNGLRQHGETVQEFAERAASEASQLDISDYETGIRRLTDPSTPEGQAYGRAFSDAAAAQVKGLRQRDPLPEPDRTPGVPHPDPFLAARGWRAGKHGVYVRKPGPQAAPRPDKELEAG